MIKLRFAPSNTAFTRKELVVVMAVLVIIAIILVPALRRAELKSRRLCCICNLVQIGTAYRIWENDHGERYPAFVSDTNGGWSTRLVSTNAGPYCWMSYAVMSNELGLSPAILICPTDERQPAANFSNIVNNSNISYFVGIMPNDSYPQALLGGDRNIGPGSNPDPEYGFSPDNGQGNDVLLKNPACWSVKMHRRSGNILLGDGSAQQATSGALQSNWIPNVLTQQSPNAAVTNLAALRVIFP